MHGDLIHSFTSVGYNWNFLLKTRR